MCDEGDITSSIKCFLLIHSVWKTPKIQSRRVCVKYRFIKNSFYGYTDRHSWMLFYF
jgi:hypothetical protein